MHIRNEARPVQPTKPNTNRVHVVAPAKPGKPQARHADRVLSARKAALSDPRVAAGIARERAQHGVEQARAELAEANLALSEGKEEGMPADTIKELTAAADAAQTAYIAAKAAFASLSEVT